MKIYTKTGDKGTTSLIGGARVPKYHSRIEAYGTIDELMAFVSLLREQKELDEQTRSVLVEVLDRLMSCASILAADCTDCRVKIPQILSTDFEFLEKEIDRMEEKLEPLSSFVLPGGHQIISLCHVSRTICRRAERLVIKLAEETPVQENLIIYLNRLSDFMFVLARFQAKMLNVQQIIWKPKV